MNEADLYAAASALARINEKAFYTAQAAALNRSIVASRTAMSKGIRQKYTISASAIKGTVTMRRASAGRLSALLKSTGSPIDLTKFKVKITKFNGASAEVIKGRKKRLPHSFFVSTKNMGLFHREKSSRLPIRKEFGPSVPQMAGKDVVLQTMQDRADQVYANRLEHEIFRRLGNT